MPEKNEAESCCSSPSMNEGCRVDSIISVDERGQMVLPKETREKAGIDAGDKLAVISWVKNGKTCCITLMKAEELTGMVKQVLGPVLEEVLK